MTLSVIGSAVNSRMARRVSQLSLFFEKQFFDHSTPLKIRGDLKHCPVVLNVLLNDKTLQKSPAKGAAALSLTLELDQKLFAYFV